MQDKWFLVSMMMSTEYQLAQRTAAEGMARRLGVRLEFVDCKDDAVTQTQQILSYVQRKQDRPAAVICIPVGSGMPQVAQEAARHGVSWVMVNREVDYLDKLRSRYGVTAFSIRPDDIEIGRILGRQTAAMLPNGGNAIYLCGPSSSDVTQLRNQGFCETRPMNLNVRTVHGAWSRESGRKVIASLLQLSTSQDVRADLLISHNDDMAIGAREALDGAGAHWAGLRYLGVDGLPSVGCAMVDRGRLTTTICSPTTTDVAIQALVEAMEMKKELPLHISVMPKPYPELKQLCAYMATF